VGVRVGVTTPCASSPAQVAGPADVPWNSTRSMTK
jgi:hypothetical protein